MTIEFATWLAEVAIVNKLTVREVLAAWKKYCQDCANFDQSPVKFEFLHWNGWRELPDSLIEREAKGLQGAAPMGGV